MFTLEPLGFQILTEQVRLLMSQLTHVAALELPTFLFTLLLSA